MPEESSEARERVLGVAERLFSERGYAAVTVRDIAEALGMRQASLYYHAPGGKAALFVAITERRLARHRQGLESAIATSGGSLRGQLRAAARWLLTQPPLDLARMERADMPAIGPPHDKRLMRAAYDALIRPLVGCFERAAARERLRVPDAHLLAGAFLAIVDGLQDADRYTRAPKADLADAMIDVLHDGIRPR